MGFNWQKERMKVLQDGNIPKSGGKNQLKRHQRGERLTQRQMIIAKCADCCGYYIDGRFSCEMPDCPLFPHMPYKKIAQSKSEAVQGGQACCRII